MARCDTEGELASGVDNEPRTRGAGRRHDGEVDWRRSGPGVRWASWLVGGKGRGLADGGQAAVGERGKLLADALHSLEIELGHREAGAVRGDGEHGARSAKQAIAIGLSKARRAGVKLPPPPKTASERTKRGAKSDSAKAGSRKKPSPARSRAAKKALADEPRAAASHEALSRHAKAAARRRPAKARKAAAKKAAKTRARQS